MPPKFPLFVRKQQLTCRSPHAPLQVMFMNDQAAAAGRTTMAMPQQAAQALQRQAFEVRWQQLDAEWQQARAAEQQAWQQMRAEQVGAAGGNRPSEWHGVLMSSRSTALLPPLLGAQPRSLLRMMSLLWRCGADLCPAGARRAALRPLHGQSCALPRLVSVRIKSDRNLPLHPCTPQWQDLLEIWQEQEAVWQAHMHNQRVLWQQKKANFWAGWQATVKRQQQQGQGGAAPAAAEAAPEQEVVGPARQAPAPAAQPAHEEPQQQAAQQAQDAFEEVVHATQAALAAAQVVPPVAEPPAAGAASAAAAAEAPRLQPAGQPARPQRQPAAPVARKRLRPEDGASDDAAEAPFEGDDEGARPAQSSNSTPPQAPTVSSPAAALPRVPSAEVRARGPAVLVPY